jgi:hypothetical protein
MIIRRQLFKKSILFWRRNTPVRRRIFFDFYKFSYNYINFFDASFHVIEVNFFKKIILRKINSLLEVFSCLTRASAIKYVERYYGMRSEHLISLKQFCDLVWSFNKIFLLNGINLRIFCNKLFLRYKLLFFLFKSIFVVKYANFKSTYQYRRAAT